jgi:hypothetical protein
VVQRHQFLHASTDRRFLSSYSNLIKQPLTDTQGLPSNAAFLHFHALPDPMDRKWDSVLRLLPSDKQAFLGYGRRDLGLGVTHGECWMAVSVLVRNHPSDYLHH